MEQIQHPMQSESSDVPAAGRKPYTPPEVVLLGRMSDRTLGVNGSRFDPGHNNNNKFGMG
jgi:hypothetical protein